MENVKPIFFAALNLDYKGNIVFGRGAFSPVVKIS